MRRRKYPPAGYTERLNEVMMQQDLTQSELARRLGVAHSSVNAWTLGDTVTDVTTFAKLTKILGVSADYLLFGRR